MKYGIYFQRNFWLVVPEILYLVLLFGGWLTVVISAGIIIAGITRKKEKKRIIRWGIVLILAFAMVIMTMTGKIVPNTAFGG